MASTRGFQVRPLTVLLVLVAIACVVIAVIYFTTAAGKLPSVLPGHQSGVTRHHTKHGVAMIGLAVLALIGAWFTTSPSQGEG